MKHNTWPIIALLLPYYNKTEMKRNIAFIIKARLGFTPIKHQKIVQGGHILSGVGPTRIVTSCLLSFNGFLRKKEVCQ